MFVISQIDENERTPIRFWSGSEFVDDLQRSLVYDTTDQVREDASRLQRDDYKIEVRILKVKRHVEIAE